MRTPYVGMQSPWGVVSDVETVLPADAEGDGVYFCSTPSHGGFWVGQEWRHVLNATGDKYPRAPRSKTWYEEDCEAGLVIEALWEYGPWGSITLEQAEKSNAYWYGERRKAERRGHPMGYAAV